jgi:hypothetical protein
MKTILGAVMTLAIITPAFGGGKDPAPAVPQYNVKAETDLVGTVVKIREVPAGEAFAGTHLTMQVRNETIDVFLGPADFIKLMALPLKAGLKDVGITGSKVKFEGNDLVLARELRIDKTVLSLRDETGFPNWLWATRTGISTGGF